jgi:hypothetical protein
MLSWFRATGAPPERSQQQPRIGKLEQKIQQQNEILAEIMAEHDALKKSLGNSERMPGGGHRRRRIIRRCENKSARSHRYGRNQQVSRGVL